MSGSSYLSSQHRELRRGSRGWALGPRAHPWDGVLPFKMHYSIAFKRRSIAGRPPLGEILYPPLELGGVAWVRSERHEKWQVSRRGRCKRECSRTSLFQKKNNLALGAGNTNCYSTSPTCRLASNLRTCNEAVLTAAQTPRYRAITTRSTFARPQRPAINRGGPISVATEPGGAGGASWCPGHLLGGTARHRQAAHKTQPFGTTCRPEAAGCHGYRRV